MGAPCCASRSRSAAESFEAGGASSAESFERGLRALPSLPVRADGELESDSSSERRSATKEWATPQASAIHRSDRAPHSASFKSVITARRLSAGGVDRVLRLR